ncbi:MAG: SDR family oxidoreductase [Cycloclasticus sp.]|uniref:dTDP-4-dehydrorhamnose reductase family protein n=1 Tax=Cycloclasticus sp. TaxID=2024830 RepID=UPI00257BEA9D|nr:SDR family oxidoreductase [Cycloclasticus sp.]MBV1899524.1 SDR family oxidoreductase [Cycloclasticus sp.]
MKVLVLGVTGMLGSAVFKQMFNDSGYQVWGTLRSVSGLKYFSERAQEYLLSNIDVLEQDSLVAVLCKVRPDVVINCVGLIKQLSDVDDPLFALPINTMLPHRLSKLCSLANARLIHISTDCVFNGRKGMYLEKDVSDAEDLYGKSKYIGELHDLPHTVTLRTSIIGHELNSNASLVNWFLTQTGSVKGYKRAIFSGLTTVELANVIKELVIPNKNLQGLYHVSVEPIDKYTLLNLIADVYGKKIEIQADEQVQIDRSLDSSKFRRETGYKPPSWPQLIEKMHKVNQGIE